MKHIQRKAPGGGGGSRSRRAGSALAGRFAETRLAWPSMPYYQRFEQIVAVIHTLRGLSAVVPVVDAIYWLVRAQESKQKLEGAMRLAGGARREQGERGADKRQGVTGVRL
ncbi:hypothetical protein [Billgrantia desiderata]|uniref:hypothetical protein n=1 Tax=Billgrantia desiderata TaxID=52021 RepID=UPI00289B4955